MQDASGVSGGESFRKLPGDGPGLPDRHGVFGNGLAECASLDELHRDPRSAIAFADVVDRDDRGMVADLFFAVEPYVWGRDTHDGVAYAVGPTWYFDFSK